VERKSRHRGPHYPSQLVLERLPVQNAGDAEARRVMQDRIECCARRRDDLLDDATQLPCLDERLPAMTLYDSYRQTEVRN
jgi:hypothetical protein